MNPYTLTADQIEALEALVDCTSAYAVVEALSEICGHKADHLRTNWQDERSAKAWDRDASLLCTLANRLA